MKQKPVVRRRRADDDIQVALAYYLNEAGVEIATAFVERLENALSKISKQPAIGSQNFGQLVGIPDLRQWGMRGFPYLIFYLEKAHHTELTRVLHSSRDIPSWLTETE